MRRTAAQLFARSVDKPRGRILFIEDQVPLRRLGTGFVRSNDIVRTMAEMGYRVTIFPVIHKSFDLAAVYADLPDTVEVMHDRSLAGLGSFLASRRGSFDTIWIARTHNLDRVKPILERGGVDVLGGVRVVLDTEAIAATRDSLRRTLQGRAEPFDQSAAIGQELANAYFCQSIVAVNEPEARLLRDQGLSDVHVLGHVRDLALTPRPWTDRAGMLFVGAFAAPDSPNYDGLCWFVDEVLPLVELALGYETQLTVVGTMGEGVGLPPEEWRVEIRASCCHADADLGHILACLRRRSIADPRMQALPVVEDFDVLEHRRLGLRAGPEAGLVDVLLLQRGKEAFHRCIIPAVAAPAHGRDEAVPFQHRAIRT
jgi:hypothetical protein